MAITKNIVEMMNGQISVDSEKGKGTTFTVAVTLTESARRNESVVEGDLHPHEMSILVIDDDPVACEHAQIVLGQMGIDCDIAASGEEGIRMVVETLDKNRIETVHLYMPVELIDKNEKSEDDD